MVIDSLGGSFLPDEPNQFSGHLQELGIDLRVIQLFHVVKFILRTRSRHRETSSGLEKVFQGGPEIKTEYAFINKYAKETHS